MIGAAGYIAPRHMEAIKKTGNNLIAVHDINDSIGIIDKYFPDALYFNRYKKFIDFIKTQQIHNNIDFLTVCSPNYMHLEHITLGLKNDIDIICEKPIVLNPSDLNKIQILEKKYKRKVNCILQLRLNKKLINLRRKITQSKKKNYKVSIKYVSYRGDWFFKSWKGNISKSGGIATNIGIHFFDLLFWLFGELKENKILLNFKDQVSGNLIMDRAHVDWFVSVKRRDLPINKNSTYRSINIDDKEIEFSDNFNDLHTLSYIKILEDKGFSLNSVNNSIKLCYQIRRYKK